MKRYYALIGFWLGTAAGILILSLVILEAKEQNQNKPIDICQQSEEHKQVMDRLESIEYNISKQSAFTNISLENIEGVVFDTNMKLDGVGIECADANYACQQ